jgi:hypothetical protein
MIGERLLSIPAISTRSSCQRVLRSDHRDPTPGFRFRHHCHGAYRTARTAAEKPHLDGGRTSIQSPAIVLPSLDSGGALTLTFSYYLAHGTNFRRATITWESRSSALRRQQCSRSSATVDLSAFAGQTVRILVEAADAAGASLVEAAIDDVKIVRR